MSTRTRPPIQSPPAAGGNGDSQEGMANELRERARNLRSAADRAIEDALSNDSAQFLRNSVQSGGQ